MKDWYSRHEGAIWAVIGVVSALVLVGVYAGGTDLSARYPCGVFDRPDC